MIVNGVTDPNEYVYKEPVTLVSSEPNTALKDTEEPPAACHAEFA